MNRNKTSKLAFVVALAAVVAALTTVTVLILRAKAKRRSLRAYNDAFDYDLDDCDCGDCGCSTCECVDAEDDATVGQPETTEAE